MKDNSIRIRLKSGRVIGPLTLSDVESLIHSNTVTGEEDFQNFPVGEWGPIGLFPEVQALLDKVRSSHDIDEKHDETFMINLQRIKLDEADDQSIDEGQSQEHVEYDYSKDGQENKISIEDLEIIQSPIIVENTPETEKKIEEDKTPHIVEEEKTKLNPDYQKYLKELKQEALKKEKEEKKRALQEQEKKEAIEIIEAEPDYEEEATQMINIKELKSTLSKALEDDEQLVRKEKKVRKEVRRKKKKQRENFETEDDIKPSFDLKKVLVGLVILFGLYFTLFEEEKKSTGLKPIKTIDPIITFNSRYDVENEEKSKLLLKKGIISYNKGSYLDILNSTKYFVESLKEKFNDNSAAAWLIFTYSQILHNSKNFNKDANTILKLVKNFSSLKLKDPNYASAIGAFYLNIGKIESAKSLLDRYRLIPSNKSTVRLFAVHLDILTQAAVFDQAQSYADKLMESPNKKLYTLIALYKYYKSQGIIKTQVELITQASNKFPNSAFFLLERGNLLLANGELDEVRKIIFKLNAINVESSRFYHSRYLALKGLYKTGRGNISDGIKDIRRSIVLYDDEELLEKLAQLSQTDNEDANQIIRRAKSDRMLRSAENNFNRHEYNEAFKDALKALEIDSDNKKANLLIAKLQLEKGYLDDAIRQLEELDKKIVHRSIYDYKESLDVKYLLVDAYTDAFKIKSANQLLQLINKMIRRTRKSEKRFEATMFNNDDRYYAAKSKLFRAKNDYASALLWLTKARKNNPLNEKNIENFIDIYIANNEYSKAEKYLNEAMDLNPVNIDYRIIKAKILYEVESLDTAVGYLYDVLEEFPDNPKIYSAIGIYFYQSGKIKNYKNIKKKLMSLPNKDIALYEFLLESARLDEDYDKIIEFSRKIIQLKPGDLSRRLYLAQVLIGLKRYSEAMKELKEIETRYKNYPRLNYFIARLHFLSGNLDKSLDFAKLEVKQNPGVIDGYLIMGDIYVEKSDYVLARKNYLEVARIDNSNVDAILGIALIAAINNQFDMAVDQYNKAIKLSPNRAEIYRLLGNTYRKIEQTQLAIKNYKQFLELSPNSSYKRELEGYIRKLE